MFKNDERYWDINLLNKWFAISSIIFLATTVWIFVDDNDDEFKVPDVTNLQVNDKNEPNENKQQTIVFCVPGKTFTNRFLVLWSELLLQCLLNGYRPILCQENDKNLFICRNKCLGANLLSNDENQKPFHYLK